MAASPSPLILVAIVVVLVIIIAWWHSRKSAATTTAAAAAASKTPTQLTTTSGTKYTFFPTASFSGSATSDTNFPAGMTLDKAIDACAVSHSSAGDPCIGIGKSGSNFIGLGAVSVPTPNVTDTAGSGVYMLGWYDPKDTYTSAGVKYTYYPTGMCGTIVNNPDPGIRDTNYAANSTYSDAINICSTKQTNGTVAATPCAGVAPTTGSAGWPWLGCAAPGTANAGGVVASTTSTTGTGLYLLA